MFFSKTKKETLVVQGMTCSHCEQTVEKGLRELPGIEKVKADHKQNQVVISFKGDTLDKEAVRKKIVDLGYEVAGS